MKAHKLDRKKKIGLDFKAQTLFKKIMIRLINNKLLVNNKLLEVCNKWKMKGG